MTELLPSTAIRLGRAMERGIGAGMDTTRIANGAPSPTKQRSNGMELIEQVALAICREVDDPSCFQNEQEAVRCYTPHAQAALTTMQAREATLIRVLEPFAGLAEKFSKTEGGVVEICAPHPNNPSSRIEPFYTSHFDELLEALATNGLDEPTADDSRRPSA